MVQCKGKLPGAANRCGGGVQSAGKGRLSRVKSLLRGLTDSDTRIVDSIDSESEVLRTFTCSHCLSV